MVRAGQGPKIRPWSDRSDHCQARN